MTFLPATRQASIALGVVIIAALCGLAFIGLYGARPPLPRAGVSAAEFSVARAQAYLPQLATRPHPIGTQENQRVRGYLIAELHKLGLQAHVQTGIGLRSTPRRGIAGRVHNIVVKVPGRQPGKALLLAAHYDSVPSGPGAADNAASVAAILETLRAVKAGKPLLNDLICIFTDGEEVGLLGADAFIDEHPWAKTIGLALNFEYRGNSGPMILFETSGGNGKLIAGFARAAPRPIGNSLLYEAYKRLPNDTDMTAFKRAGIPSLNFAAIEGLAAYHTRLDSPEHLSANTLQHEGDIMLGLVRYFGDRPLQDLKAPDSVFFDVPYLGLLHYSSAWVLPLCGAAMLLVALACVNAVRRGEVRVVAGGLAAVAFLLSVAALAAAAQLLWLMLLKLHPDYQLMRLGETYNGPWYRVGFTCLTIGAFAGIQSQLMRRLRALELAVGALLSWLLLLMVCAFSLPGASFILTWPLLAVSASLVWLVSRRGREASAWVRALVLLVGAAPGVLLFAPLVHLLFVGMTFNLVFVPVLALAMLLGILTPLSAIVSRRFGLTFVGAIAGAVSFAIGSATGGFSIDRPRPNNLFYVQDGVSRNAVWLSSDPRLDDWTRRFFPKQPERRAVPELLGLNPNRHWIGPAPVLGVSAPAIEVLYDRNTTDARILHLRLRSIRQAPQWTLAVEGADVLSSTLAGHTLTQDRRADWSLNAYGFAADDVSVRLLVEPKRPFLLRLIDRSYGLPPGVGPRRPDDMMVQPVGSGDTVQAVTTMDFR